MNGTIAPICEPVREPERKPEPETSAVGIDLDNMLEFRPVPVWVN